MLLLGVCASWWSHQLTSDPKKCLLFWKCLQWSCPKAGSFGAYICHRRPRGSTATGGSRYSTPPPPLISRASCELTSLALGLLNVGRLKENIRELEKIVAMAEDDHEYFGDAHLKSYSCVGIFVWTWSSTTNHQSLLNFAGVGGREEQEKRSRCFPKKVDWAAEGRYLTTGKNFRWVVVQSGTSEKKTNRK